MRKFPDPKDFADCAINPQSVDSKCREENFKDRFLSETDSVLYTLDIEIQRLTALRESIYRNRNEFITPINPLEDVKCQLKSVMDENFHLSKEHSQVHEVNDRLVGQIQKLKKRKGTRRAKSMR